MENIGECIHGTFFKNYLQSILLTLYIRDWNRIKIHMLAVLWVSTPVVSHAHRPNALCYKKYNAIAQGQDSVLQYMWQFYTDVGTFCIQVFKILKNHPGAQSNLGLNVKKNLFYSGKAAF